MLVDSATECLQCLPAELHNDSRDCAGSDSAAILKDFEPEVRSDLLLALYECLRLGRRQGALV